jgi:hypothetical protein
MLCLLLKKVENHITICQQQQKNNYPINTLFIIPPLCIGAASAKRLTPSCLFSPYLWIRIYTTDPIFLSILFAVYDVGLPSPSPLFFVLSVNRISSPL